MIKKIIRHPETNEPVYYDDEIQKVYFEPGGVIVIADKDIDYDMEIYPYSPLNELCLESDVTEEVYRAACAAYNLEHLLPEKR